MMLRMVLFAFCYSGYLFVKLEYTFVKLNRFLLL